LALLAASVIASVAFSPVTAMFIAPSPI
jgi:hypothetical protein